MPAFDPPPERTTGYSTADGKRVIEALEYLRPIAHVPFTLPITVSATEPIHPADVVSAGAIEYEAGAYKVEFFAPQATIAGLEFFKPLGKAMDVALVCSLWDDNFQLGPIAALETVSTAGKVAAPLKGEAHVDLETGSHTLKIRAYCSGGEGTIHAGRGATNLPGFIRITRDIPMRDVSPPDGLLS